MLLDKNCRTIPLPASLVQPPKKHVRSALLQPTTRYKHLENTRNYVA